MFFKKKYDKDFEEQLKLAQMEEAESLDQLDYVKERLQQKRDLEKNKLKEELEKLDKSKYTEAQLEALEYAVSMGLSLKYVAYPSFEALKIKAIADAFQEGAPISTIEKMYGMNFMQIRYALIPALKKEYQKIYEEKQLNKNNSFIDTTNMSQDPVLKTEEKESRWKKQMILLKYMYDSLKTGNSYEMLTKIKASDEKTVNDYENRYLITYAGKQNHNGYVSKRVTLSHGYLNEVKPILIFSIDNRKNTDGIFRMYSKKDEPIRDIDLDASDLDMFYNSVLETTIVMSLDSKLHALEVEIENERKANAAARMERMLSSSGGKKPRY